jgi:carboxyl-terminal processing protease
LNRYEAIPFCNSGVIAMKSHFTTTLLAASMLAMLPASATLAQSKQDPLADMDEFIAVYKRVKASYVDKVDDKQLMEGAIQGMLQTLDPHSAFLDKSDFQSLQTQIDGEYGGLGLSVTLEEGAVKVIAPTADTPADKAGLKSGDYITHLDGKLIVGGTLDEAVNSMRGQPGTSIKLTIFRPGRDAPFDVTLTRAIIDLKPVKWEVKDKIGVKGIEAKLGAKPTGYIVDLRSNPGGILDEAVKVSDAFLDKGEIVSERGRDKVVVQRWFAESEIKGDVTGGKPVIILVDAGSASASEIVAGALQDHHRALIMGERSFGKGSVQNVLPLSRDTGLRLTVARYHLPSGRSVQEGGVKPDIAVPQISDPDLKKRLKTRESDLRRHLVNELAVEDKAVEEDNIDDPRFAMSAEELKKQGIEDFQLHYAMQTLERLGSRTTKMAETVPPTKVRKP